MATTHSSLNHLFILLMLIPSIASAATLSSPHPDIPKINDELIDKICSKTSNSSFCRKNLERLKGRELIFDPIQTIGSRTMEMIVSSAGKTLAWTQLLYEGNTTADHKPESEKKYYICFLKYYDINNKLKEANRWMRADEKKGCVEKYISEAVSIIESCDKDFMHLSHERGSDVLVNSIRELKDLCSVVLSICNVMKSKGKDSCTFDT